MSEFVARIKPSSKRELHVLGGRTFLKSRGWYGPFDAGFAEVLREEPENELSPTSGPKVFDVQEKNQAREIERQERAREPPKGTIDTPAAPGVVPGAGGANRPGQKDEAKAERARAKAEAEAKAAAEEKARTDAEEAELEAEIAAEERAKADAEAKAAEEKKAKSREPK